jgi:aromatic ring-cleaving dioxygenase
LSLPSVKLRAFTNSPFTVPELRVYRVWDKPIGPHPIAMFEVNLFTPAQFGAFIPWLVINRGPLSALLHPNTGDDIRDHTQRATWLGQPFPLQIGLLRRLLERRDEAVKSNQQAN